MCHDPPDKESSKRKTEKECRKSDTAYKHLEKRE